MVPREIVPIRGAVVAAPHFAFSLLGPGRPSEDCARAYAWKLDHGTCGSTRAVGIDDVAWLRIATPICVAAFRNSWRG